MPMTDTELVALRPDALAPAAIEAKAETVAIAKTQLPVGRLFVLAMLAGAYIALGGMFFGLVLADGNVSFLATRMLGGLAFCLGLSLVLCCGAELFTGNALMVTALLSKKIGVGPMLKNWVLVWLGNLCGALVVVLLLWGADFASMNAGAVGAAFVKLAGGKMALAPGVAFAKGILCNVLVCLGVYIGFAGRTIVDKVIGILLPITAFVACGFEHCVANMFFLPFGMVLSAVGFGDVTVATQFGGLLANLGMVTLGNIVGGAIIGIAYWLAYAKRV